MTSKEVIETQPLVIKKTKLKNKGSNVPELE